MSDYKMNKPVIAGKETVWYKMLRALYRFNKPAHKKEWLYMSAIHFSDENPKITKTPYGSHSKWPYRHWRGLYPAMFKHFQRLKLVSYNCKEKKWTMNRLDYELFCLSLNVEP